MRGDHGRGGHIGGDGQSAEAGSGGGEIRHRSICDVRTADDIGSGAGRGCAGSQWAGGAGTVELAGVDLVIRNGISSRKGYIARVGQRIGVRDLGSLVLNDGQEGVFTNARAGFWIAVTVVPTCSEVVSNDEATARLVTCPASRSAWVIEYVPVQVRLDTGLRLAGAALQSSVA